MAVGQKTLRALNRHLPFEACRYMFQISLQLVTVLAHIPNRAKHTSKDFTFRVTPSNGSDGGTMRFKANMP